MGGNLFGSVQKPHDGSSRSSGSPSSTDQAIPCHSGGKASYELLQVVREGVEFFLEDVQFPVGDAVPLQVFLYVIGILHKAPAATA